MILCQGAGVIFVSRRFGRSLWDSVEIPQIVAGQSVESMHVINGSAIPTSLGAGKGT